jgi:nucleoside-diphosphate-sugar epimerase
MARILVTGGSGFIGSHLLPELVGGGHDVLNIDMQPPHADTAPWQRADIKDRAALDAAFSAFRPSHVVHLAARTDLDGRTREDYVDNTVGTETVIAAAHACGTVERFVATSTQYVVKPGVRPASLTEFDAYSAYGISKVETEKITRAQAAPMVWTIIRPTNIWGPRHPFLPGRVWYYIARGLYVHPGRQPIRRAYAYVGSVVYQIEAILKAPPATVEGRVFYVGETPVDFLDWANAFSTKLRGGPVRVVPRAIWRALATVGDVVPKFPMNTPRFYRMTVSDDPPIEPTYEAFGPPPVDFPKAVDTTVAWLHDYWAERGMRV